MKSMILFHYLRTSVVNSKGVFRTQQISLIELKAKIVNGLKPMTIFKMRYIFAFCFVLNTPIKSLKLKLSYTSYKTEIFIIVQSSTSKLYHNSQQYFFRKIVFLLAQHLFSLIRYRPSLTYVKTLAGNIARILEYI